MDWKLTWVLSQLIPQSLIYLSIPISSNISSTSASRRSSPVGFLEKRWRATGMRKKTAKAIAANDCYTNCAFVPANVSQLHELCHLSA